MHKVGPINLTTPPGYISESVNATHQPGKADDRSGMPETPPATDQQPSLSDWSKEQHIA